jgi:hypothetical protein
MKQVIFEGKFKTLAPFCSSNPTDKNTNEVETRKISVHYDGRKENIPFLSPNTIRSNLRDNIAKDIIEKFPNQLGYKELLFLTSGGNLEGKEEKSKGLKVREVLERIREIRENNIVASIFGGALFHLNKLIPGKLSCGIGYLVCRETMGSDDFPSFEDYKGKDLQFVRSDDTDRWEFFSALSEEGIADKEKYEVKYKESARQRQEEKKKKTNGVKTENTESSSEDSSEVEQKEVSKIASSQMIWKIKDYVVEGATFMHELLLVNPTLREVGAIIRAYERFSEFPYLGCFKNIGFGKMQVEYTIKAIENDEETELGYIKIEDIKKFEIDGDEAKKALAEYKEYLKNLTYDMIRI